MGCIAFYPWLRINERLSFTDFELIPFKLNAKNQQLDSPEEDADVKGVASNYKNSVGHSLNEIVVFKFKQLKANSPLTEEKISQCFLLNELITFASLSASSFILSSLSKVMLF